GRLAGPLFPGHGRVGGEYGRRRRNAPHVQGRAGGDGGGGRADREQQARPSPARVVEPAPESGCGGVERLEERGVVDEENLGERGAALQADLLARVEALRLVDLP